MPEEIYIKLQESNLVWHRKQLDRLIKMREGMVQDGDWEQIDFDSVNRLIHHHECRIERSLFNIQRGWVGERS